MPREGKTLAKSFRVNVKALEALREEAERQNISVNALLNQVLINYTEFGRFFHRANAMTLTRKTFAEILNRLSESAVTEAGQTAGKSAPEAMVLTKRGKVTVDTVMEYIRELSTYGNFFEYSEKYESGRWTIILMHELGSRWSTFLTHYLGEAFAAAGVQPSVRRSDRAVIFNL